MRDNLTLNCEPICKDKIRDALKKMANGKVKGPDQIPIEVWKCLEEEGLKWLTSFSMLFFGLLRCLKNGGIV